MFWLGLLVGAVVVAPVAIFVTLYITFKDWRPM